VGRPRLRGALILGLLILAAVLPATGGAQQDPDTSLTGQGRKLDPVGRMTQLGAFPTGGAITPDGRFYWAVDAGRGANFVRVVDMATGEVRQTLPLPGGYVGIAFAPDGKRAYISGLRSDGTPPAGSKGTSGDVIHVYSVDTASGDATELEPIALPDAADGSAAEDELPPASGVAAWPEGLDVTDDGTYLVVALGQADQAAIIDLRNGDKTLANVGRYPYGVVTDPRRPRAYVTNERDGSVSVIEIPSGRLIDTIFVGGPRGAPYAHPEGITADPVRDLIYVAVTGRDLVAVIDTSPLRLRRLIDVGRSGVPIGVAPVAVSVAPNGDTLYVANTGEDAVVAVALEDRPETTAGGRPRDFLKTRSVKQIGRFHRARTRRPSAKRLRSLRRRLLFGKKIKACGGPRKKQDRAWGRRVLKAHARRARARRRGVPAAKRRRAFRRALRRAKRARPKIVRCPRAGFLPGADAFDILGRFPTASYTTDVEVAQAGERIAWLAAKGYGTGPNTGTQSDISRLLLGRAGVLDRPTDQEMVALTPRADRQVVPANFAPPPPNTPLVGPGGGPSDKIKYVFYVVRENRTYDQILGSEPRGNGDPTYQVFDDNGVPGPTGGVTPNAHELARIFPLLDNVHANSEESTVGHKITAGGYVNDYTQRFVNSGRGRRGNPDIFAIGIPPNAFVFDQAVRQGITFRAYGEVGAGNQPFSDDGRETFEAVQANTDYVYPTQVSGTCQPLGGNVPDDAPNSVRCAADAGEVITPGGFLTMGPGNVQSRIRTFQGQFQQQVASGTVPAFNYLILFNDHTDGSTPGVYTPKANVADNDLALGQLVELVSQSSIWAQSAILVVEDDSQSGIDHVDAHRMPAFVISPWAKKGAVISTRFDHYSFLRTAEMIVGLRPLSINDALATPLYDTFISGSEQPDVEGTRYHAIQPEQSMTETNPANAANAKLSAAMPWDVTDHVPQEIADRIIWQSVFGSSSEPPPPGPNASPIERARARGAMRVFRRGGSPRRWLLQKSGEEEEEAEVEMGELVEDLLEGLRDGDED
jgi:DNA-binding beta-propeller fold protein YncE